MPIDASMQAKPTDLDNEGQEAELVSEFDLSFRSLDRACDLLDQALDHLTSSPSPLVH